MPRIMAAMFNFTSSSHKLFDLMGDSRKLKEQYHEKLVFHGGLDNQGTFHLDTDTVIDDARQKIQAFAPGGGYLFSSGHNIQANCPPENIVALFETAKQWGKYPIQSE